MLRMSQHSWCSDSIIHLSQYPVVKCSLVSSSPTFFGRLNLVPNHLAPSEGLSRRSTSFCSVSQLEQHLQRFREPIKKFLSPCYETGAVIVYVPWIFLLSLFAGKGGVVTVCLGDFPLPQASGTEGYSFPEPGKASPSLCRSGLVLLPANM